MLRIAASGVDYPLPYTTIWGALVESIRILHLSIMMKDCSFENMPKNLRLWFL